MFRGQTYVSRLYATTYATERASVKNEDGAETHISYCSSQEAGRERRQAKNSQGLENIPSLTRWADRNGRRILCTVGI